MLYDTPTQADEELQAARDCSSWPAIPSNDREWNSVRTSSGRCSRYSSIARCSTLSATVVIAGRITAWIDSAAPPNFSKVCGMGLSRSKILKLSRNRVPVGRPVEELWQAYANPIFSPLCADPYIFWTPSWQNKELYILLAKVDPHKLS